MDGYVLAKQISKKSYYIKNNIVQKDGLAYVKFRILRPLLKFYYRLYRKKYNFSPWTSPASIDFFDIYLNKKMIGLEYGSGRSTIFFAERLNHLTSVEHHREWFNKVSHWLKSYGNVSYKLIPPDTSSKPFKSYSTFVSNFPDSHFDFILIDGRSRMKCLMNSLPKLKPGGLIVLDNSERERYKVAFELLNQWEMVHTTTGLTDTTLWFKPSS